jgi:hypothetical protein
MAGTRPISYHELYADPTKNPFGTNEEELEVCTRAVFEVFWATGLALDEGELMLNIQADFGRPIGGVAIFFPDGDSPTGVLRVLHGVHLFPGMPGRSRDRMKTFAFEGDVEGVDASSIAFDKAQLAITADIVVPGSIARDPSSTQRRANHRHLGPLHCLHGQYSYHQVPLRCLSPFRPNGDGVG